MRTQLILLCVIALSGCSGAGASADRPSSGLRIKGSDSMLLLVQRLAERYMVSHPGTPVSVEGGGSGAGIAALIEGYADLCASSRPLAPEEVSALARRHGSVGVATLCAKDALAVIVHPANPLSTLTASQIVDLFTGKVRRWSGVGGHDIPVSVYTRESNSGTFLYFEEHMLLGETYAEESTVVPGARALTAAVANDPAGIGYSTFAYAQQVKTLAVDGVLPTEENIRSGAYAVTRYLYLYSRHQPEGDMKRFLDWVTGPEGQSVAKENGYIPLYTVEAPMALPE